MNWKVYFTAIFIIILYLLIERYWYSIKWRTIRIKKKIYNIISVKKYSYSYKGIDVVYVFPFTSYINGGYSFYKTSRPIVDTYEEAEKGFFQQLNLYHEGKLDWQIANKKWEENRNDTT